MLTLSEQYIHSQLLEQALSPEDLKRVGDSLENLKNLTQGLNLPGINQAIRVASDEFSDIGRIVGSKMKTIKDKGLMKGLLSIGRAGAEKAMAFAELSAFQIMLVNLLRELPSALKMTASRVSQRLNTTSEGVMREAPPGLGQPFPTVEPEFVSKTVGDEDKGTISQKEPGIINKKQPAKNTTLEIDQVIDDIISGNLSGMDPNMTLGMVLKDEAGKVEEIIKGLADPARSGDKISGLYSKLKGRGGPFGLDPETIAKDIMNLPLKDLATLIQRGSQVDNIGLSPEDVSKAAEISDAVRSNPQVAIKKAKEKEEEKTTGQPQQTKSISIRRLARQLRKSGANEKSIRAISKALEILINKNVSVKR